MIQAFWSLFSFPRWVVLHTSASDRVALWLKTLMFKPNRTNMSTLVPQKRPPNDDSFPWACLKKGTSEMGFGFRPGFHLKPSKGRHTSIHDPGKAKTSAPSWLLEMAPFLQYLLHASSQCHSQGDSLRITETGNLEPHNHGGILILVWL